MQATTRTRILNDGQPFAATTSAPRANGSAKIVCEKRISVRNRTTGPSPLSLINIRKFLQNAAKENETEIGSWNPGRRALLFQIYWEMLVLEIFWDALCLFHLD